jgi:hypothetical protein
MTNKLDIKNEMRAIDTKDRAWYKSLTKEEREKYDKQLWIQMRWASSVKGSNAASFLMLVNEFANLDFNTLKKHPQLQLQLLQIAGTGKTEYHEWIAPGKGATKDKFAAWVASEFPEYNDEELELFMQTNTKADFYDRLEQAGMTPKEIAAILGARHKKDGTGWDD